MAEIDDLPVEPVTDPAALVCPECGYVAKGKIPALDLGAHRWHKHGIRSGKSKAPSKPKATKARERAAPRESAPARRARSVSSSVAGSTRKLGILLTPRLPVTGGYCLENADELGRLLASIAADNPTLLRWLESSEVAMDYVGLAWWAGGLVYAAGIDLNRVPAEGPIAAEFGLDEITRKVDAVIAEREREMPAPAEEEVPGVVTIDNGNGPATVLD